MVKLWTNKVKSWKVRSNRIRRSAYRIILTIIQRPRTGISSTSITSPEFIHSTSMFLHLHFNSRQELRRPPHFGRLFKRKRQFNEHVLAPRAAEKRNSNRKRAKCKSCWHGHAWISRHSSAGRTLP